MWINLYEINPKNPILENVWIIVIAIFIFIILTLIIFKSQGYRKEKAVIYAIVFCIIMSLLWSFAALVSIYAVKDNNEKIVGAYKREEYSVVEGVVTNYKENCDQIENHEDEYFEIENVSFAYREGDSWGYSCLRKNGGVVTGERQYLRICYIYLPGYSTGGAVGKNIILRIDEYKE